MILASGSSDRITFCDIQGSKFYYERGHRVYLDGGKDIGAKVKFTPTRPPREAIPREWLKERVQCQSADEAGKVSSELLGYEDGVPENEFTRKASAEWATRWEEFIREIEPGDEIWFFASPTRALSGAAGFALVRQGKPIDTIVTWRS